jgi:hypothetical protein
MNSTLGVEEGEGDWSRGGWIASDNGKGSDVLGRAGFFWGLEMDALLRQRFAGVRGRLAVEAQSNMLTLSSTIYGELLRNKGLELRILFAGVVDVAQWLGLEIRLRLEAHQSN